MGLDVHINNVIKRNSKDQDIAEAIEYYVKLLKTLDISYIVIGSTAVQTYLPYFHRIPHDFDITLPQDQIFKLKDFSENDEFLKFESNDLACKLFYKNTTYMHLIPDRMNYLDKITNKIFTTFRVHHDDRIER